MRGTVDVKLRIDVPAMRAEVGALSEGAIQKAADVSKRRFSSNIRSDGLVNTGKLANSITTAPARGGDLLAPAVVVGSPLDYAKYPNFGTRAHGPVRAKAMRFKPKGASGFVFAQWVRGVKPHRFAERTLDQVRPTDFV